LFWEWSIPVSRQIHRKVIFLVVTLAGISGAAMLQAQQPAVSPYAEVLPAQQAGRPM
jgi:hypothetical protein